MTDSNSPVKHQANRRPVAYKNEAFLDSPGRPRAAHSV